MMQAVRVAKFGDPDVCVVSKVPIPSPGSTQVWQYHKVFMLVLC